MITNLTELTELDLIDGGGFGDYFAYALGFLWQSQINAQKAANDVGMSFMAI